jgi:hypothetical protein
MVMEDNGIGDDKNTRQMLVILITMRMGRCNAGRIA